MRPIRQCAGLLRSHLRLSRRQTAIMVVLGVADALVSLAFVWLSKLLIDIVTGLQEGDVARVAVMLASVMLLQIICRVASSYCEGAAAVRSSNLLRESLFRKVIKSKGQNLMHSGDTVSRLEEDIRIVSDFSTATFPEFLVTLVKLLAASAFMFVMQPDMAWILLLIMPVAVVGSRLFFRKLRSLGVEIRGYEADIQGLVQENIQHSDLVKAQCSEDALSERLSSKQETLRRKVFERLNYNSISRFFLRLGFAGGYAFVFVWGAMGIQRGAVTYGMLVAFLQLVGQVQRPVAELARQIPVFIRALSSEDRLLDLENLPQEEELAPVLLAGAPGIEISELDFAYGEAESIYSKFSFSFAPGKMTAVLGHTGVGKSTLVKLFMALIEPDKGSISLIDSSQDRIKVSPATRCNFMYVPQGNSLMSGTIRENLLSAKPDASDEDLREVLKLAAAEFVFELKDGLDTLCSERGGGLSEGQAQRIAIARALLRPGGILVLDESTSSLDADTERRLLANMVGACKGNKTIVCITHRQAAAQIADEVLDLDTV